MSTVDRPSEIYEIVSIYRCNTPNPIYRVLYWTSKTPTTPRQAIVEVVTQDELADIIGRLVKHK